MKKILSYINPARSFKDGWGGETEKLIKVQIENSLNFGWDRKDIMLVTNFPYNYLGVKSFIVGDGDFCYVSPTATKINVILDLIRRKKIRNDEFYWHHDNDAFELEKITEDEVRAELGNEDLALTDYGVTTINPRRNLRWSTGTLFFKRSSEDIFKLIQKEVYKYEANEEICLLALLRSGRRPEIRLRIKKINITYNFATRKRNVYETWKMTRKPLKVLHFHPSDKRPVWKKYDNMDVVLGKNKMNKVLLNKSLRRLFEKHKVT